MQCYRLKRPLPPPPLPPRSFILLLLLLFPRKQGGGGGRHLSNLFILEGLSPHKPGVTVPEQDIFSRHTFLSLLFHVYF